MDPPMDYQTLRYAVADRVAAITLDRPERLNSLNAAMRAELMDALARAPREARAVVLTGAGRAFSAGQDLGEAASFSELNLERLLSEEYEPLIRLVSDCPVPVIAAVNGAAAGAGANLALAADIVVAARSASFLQAFARIGLVPDAGGTWRLPRLVGMARAKGLCLLAEPLPAERAAEWGLIWEAVDDDALHDRAADIAARLAAGPTVAYRLTREALGQSTGNDLEAQLALEARLQGEAAATRDFMEGVAAFLENRPPRFEGR